MNDSEFAMTSRFIRFAVFSAAFAVLSFAPAALPAADPAPKTDETGWILPGAVGEGWHIRLKDARAEAAKDDKPIIIVFSGPDWSTSSRKFESSVLKSKEFAPVRSATVGLYVQHFVNISAPEEQVSANQSLRKALGVPSVYPCTVILASDGKKVLGTISGALDKKAYLLQVSKLAGIAIPE